MGITNSQLSNIINYIAGGINDTEASPPQYWVGLYSGTISPDSGLVTGEIESNDITGYSRVLINNNKTTFNTAVEYGIVGNLIDIEFPKSKSDWGIIDGVAIFTSNSNNTCIYYYEFPISRDIKSDTIVYFKGSENPTSSDLYISISRKIDNTDSENERANFTMYQDNGNLIAQYQNTVYPKIEIQNNDLIVEYEDTFLNLYINDDGDLIEVIE